MTDLHIEIPGFEETLRRIVREELRAALDAVLMAGQPEVEPTTLTVEEAGRLLGISRGRAYEAVRTGEIPSVRLGRRLLVPTAQLRRMLAGSDTPKRGQREEA
jgi:excisionase family DNA binding protein